MGVIFEFIKNLSAFELVYDGLTIVFGISILINLIVVNKHMNEIKERSGNAYNNTVSDVRKNDKGNLEQSTTVIFNRQKHEPIRKDFNKLNIKYTKYISLISVLPLIGLLGTILGLIPGLAAVKEQNFEVLYSSLSTALSSTLIGLLFAIVLKIYASVKPDQMVNAIETDFDEIDRMYEMQ